jgi:condensin complex subunit 1
MDDRVRFDVNESIKNYLNDPSVIPTPEADGSLVDCENDPELLTPATINAVLNPIVDMIAENPEALTRASTFDSLQFLLKCAPISITSEQSYKKEPEAELFKLSRSSSLLPPLILSKLLDVIVSGLSTEAEIIHNDLETDEQESVQHHKQLLEMYGFLLQWAVSVVETKAAEKPSTAAPARGRGGKATKTKASAKDTNWDATAQLQSALECMCKVLKLKLGKVFMTTSERDTFVGLFTRSVYMVFESEQRTKSTAIRMHAFKHHGHAFGKLEDFFF